MKLRKSYVFPETDTVFNWTKNLTFLLPFRTPAQTTGSTWTSAYGTSSASSPPSASSRWWSSPSKCLVSPGWPSPTRSPCSKQPAWTSWYVWLSEMFCATCDLHASTAAVSHTFCGSRMPKTNWQAGWQADSSTQAEHIAWFIPLHHLPVSTVIHCRGCLSSSPSGADRHSDTLW